MYIPNIGSIPDDIVNGVIEILKQEEIYGQPSNHVRSIKWVRETSGVSFQESKMIVEAISQELNSNELRLPKMLATFLCGEKELMQVQFLRIKSFCFKVREIVPGKITTVDGYQNDIMELIGKLVDCKIYSLYKVEIL